MTGLDIGIDLIASLFLLGLAAYILMLGWQQLQGARRLAQTHELEMQELHARIAGIMDETHFKSAQREGSWSGVRKFQIQRKAPEPGGVCSFYLTPHNGKPLPPFMPGQYLTFSLEIPGESKPLVRCYSLSDSPNHPDYYRVSIKKIPPPRDKPELPSGKGSSFFHDALAEGDIIDVKAPAGHFFLDMTYNSPVVLIGGGIGLTPVLSMLNAIVESGSKRETWFFYGVRNKDEHAFQEHLKRIDRENENVHMHICYSNPREGSDVEGEDYQHAERVSADLFKRLLPSNNYDFYTCGPPPMMNSITEGLQAWGVPDERIHYEAFGPATVKKTPQAREEMKDDAGLKFAVEFARSNKTLQWDESLGSILELAEANGIPMDSGCRAGSCGTCLTAIKNGDVKYLSEPGAAPEKGSCLACISVPSGNLCIDA